MRVGGRRDAKLDAPRFFFFPYLGILERHVDGEAGAEARESLEVGGVGQRAAALGEHGEGQRFEVLAVDVSLPAVHRLQQILAGDDLPAARKIQSQTLECRRGF